MDASSAGPPHHTQAHVPRTNFHSVYFFHEQFVPVVFRMVVLTPRVNLTDHGSQKPCC